MRSLPIFVAAFVAGLAGCADVQKAQIQLAASRINAGKVAWASLVDRGEQTAVSITAAGVPPQVSRPVHLYTYIYEGVCSDLPSRPAHSLNATVLARSMGAAGSVGPPFKIENTAMVRLEVLLATPHALLVRSAPADGNLDLFCGDIGTGRRA